MSDEYTPGAQDEHDRLPSVEQIASLDAYLDHLVADRSDIAAASFSDAEIRDRLLAAQFQLARDDAEQPRPDFLRDLERRVGQAIARETAQGPAEQQKPISPSRRERAGYSRGRFLQVAARTAATLVGGAGLGVGATEAVAHVQEDQRPHALVVAGNDRWYPIATSGEVQPGGFKAFTAGGVMGFLFNVDGRLHAVSSLCTHMGCRLKPDTATQPDIELRCLCHNSRFNNAGEVLHGLAPTPLPRITVREENGQVLALGTRETV